MKVRIANRSRLEGYNKSRLPEFTNEEKELNKGTNDYFAFNNYMSFLVTAIPEPAIVLPPSFENDVGAQAAPNSSVSNRQK